MNIPEALHEQDTQSSSYPGEILARAREAHGLSLDYVAGKLHLRVKVVECIEQDLYESLPEPVFVQGYLRAYAKLLGLAPDMILERYNARKEPEKKHEQRILRQQQKIPVSVYRDHKSRWLMTAAGFILLVSGYYWWTYHDKVFSKDYLAKTTEVVPSEKNTSQTQALVDLSSMESSNLAFQSGLVGSSNE